MMESSGMLFVNACAAETFAISPVSGSVLTTSDTAPVSVLVVFGDRLSKSAECCLLSCIGEVRLVSVMRTHSHGTTS